MRCLLLPLWLSLTLSSLAYSGQATAQIPKPTDFLSGYTTAFTPHHQLVDYFEAVAETSPRVQLYEYGRSYEGRPLLVAFVSSSDNIRNLQAIRTAHLSRSGITQTTPTAKPVAVVWLSYSVHGNEAAGSEASIQVLYDLATAAPGNTDSLAAFLENTIVIIDPSLNPDGYTRYTDDQRRRATKFPQAHPSAWEHTEAWPNGRTNHYLFDLNRDWAWATQKETQARLTLYQQWMPHVHADVHEMGHNSSYYFAPAAEPFHDYITDFQRSFQTKIGQNHARLFDAQGWLYYTREEFDLLYPSYGDTYPTFNGAIGMTYEQAGSGFAGRAVETAFGDTLTLADRIAHHHATSLSTIAVASRNAEQLIAASADFRKAATSKPRGKAEAYVFPLATNSPAKLQSLLRILNLHAITYGSAASTSSISGQSYSNSQITNRKIAKGDLVVPARQMQGVLAQVLLDPSTRVPDSLTYDITAWSLPTVLGLDGYALHNTVALGDTFQLPRNTAMDAPAYGFAINMDGFGAWQAVAPLLREGLVARYAPTASELGAQVLPAGTLFVLARDFSSSAYAKTYSAAVERGLSLLPLRSGFARKGFDIGSDNVSKLAAPTVVLVQADEVDVNAFGHVWHMFEQRLDYPIRPVPWQEISLESLADVDVVIIPDSRLDFTGGKLESLTAWVRGGGRLIVMEASAEALGAAEGFALSKKEDKPGLRTADDDDPMPAYANRQRARISSNVPGALIETQVDHTHPLAFGLGKDFYTLRTAERRWAFLKDGYNVIGLRTSPDVRGFVGSDVLAELEETLTIGVQPLGQGEVVYAADNLAYRGFWEHGMQVLANAVFYR